MDHQPEAIPVAVPPPSKRLSGIMSMAMVVGTMIGSGIYLLPTTLAPYGPNLVTAFVVTIAGTMLLAITFARLATRIRGGPFIYVAQAGAEGLVAAQRAISVGLITGNDYEVTSGLKLGEKVVTTGVQKLRDGAALAPEG